MKTDLTENSPVGSRTTTKHGDGGREETENSLDKKQKSILIFDTPTRCYDCPLYTSIGDEDDSADEYGFCDDRNILGQEEAQEKIRFDEKPSWCPLKDLPRKRDIDKTLEFGGYENIIQESLARGYNACLEEITK